MGEVQEQRYACKICSKIYSSGKSLGGHMRQHSALISSSKKATTSKADINMDSEITDDQDSLKLEDGSKIRPKSAFPREESLNNCSNTSDSEDADRNSNYELRDDLKKSCRISDPRPGFSTASCRECGKEFPTSRALSGHMRSHSMKNKKEIHHCKMCGKGFESVRAMFGHMKSHPKRSRPVLADESSDSLSDFENLCPVRKKRSMIRYKSTISNPNPSCSNLNESDSAVLELGEVEEVAEILIMLSRNVRDCSKFDSCVKSSDNGDGFTYFGAEAYSKGKNFVENDDKTKAGFGVADDAQFNITKIAKLEKLNEFSAELVTINSCSVSLLQESISGMNSSGREASAGILKGLEKGKKRQCPICFKVFSSGQALGGHKRAHFKTGFRTENENEGAMRNEEDGDAEVSEDSFDLNFPLAMEQGIERDVQLGLWWAHLTD